MRVLGRIRLSRLTDESTSAARQRELIEQWSQMHEHEIVGWAEDLDVSGSVDPFDTPSLGPWLSEDKRGDWDILVAWKLDRVGRRAIPLNHLFGWVMEHNKTLVCVSDNIDLSTWVGRLVANVIAGVAEGELEAIKERTKASRKRLLESGRWPGGTVPYGFRAQEIETGGWRLTTDPVTSAVVVRIAGDIINGLPIEAVSKALNEEGVPGPAGGRWIPESVWKIVEGKVLIGHATYKGNTVRDQAGRPVLYADPILEQETWDRMQAAIEQRKHPEAERYNQTSPLLGVLFCSECGQKMYYRVYRRRTRDYRYYFCRKHKQLLKADELEDLLAKRFIEEVGHFNAEDRFFVPAENHQMELEEATRAVEELTALLGTLTSTTMRSSITGQLQALDSRISQLEKLPSRDAHWEYRNMDYTYAEEWESSDTDGRRRLLLRSEMTAQASKRYFHFHVPEDMLERLRSSK